jgi:hypothetical protein
MTQKTEPESAGFDQEEEEPGELMCTLSTDGRDGSWLAEDANGEPLIVRRNGDGTLAIHHLPNTIGDQEEPTGTKLEVTGEYPAPTSPGAAHDAAALRRWQRNGRGSVQDEYRANAEYARRIASYYERR